MVPHRIALIELDGEVENRMKEEQGTSRRPQGAHPVLQDEGIEVKVQYGEKKEPGMKWNRKAHHHHKQTVVVERVINLHILVGVVVDPDDPTPRKTKRATVVAVPAVVVVVVVTITTAVRVASSTTSTMPTMTIGVEVEVLGGCSGRFRQNRPHPGTRRIP